MISPSLYEAVFNSGTTGNYLLSPTPDAIILAVNDTFLKASLRTREDLVGKSLFDAFPGNPDDTGDSGETMLRRSIMRVIETGQPDLRAVHRYPIPIQLPNGEKRYEERFWSNASTPVFDAGGRMLCISHTTSDITDKVRSEAALRETERRFRALISATADVVYRMSPDWTQMRQLEGRGFLKNTSDPDHFWLDAYIPPQDQPLVHAAAQEAIRERRVFELEHRVLRLDGSIGWMLSRAVPMLDDHGEIDEWIGAASDITKRKQTEEKLRLSDQRKDEFLAMLAHELRNPLAPISAAAELLQRTSLDETRVRNTSRIIGRQVEHMRSLVDDLLDVSRVTHGAVELDKAPVEIGSIVGDAVEQVAPLARARGHQLALRLAPRAMLVEGDHKRLVQIVANLLNNAAKYTPEGGNIAIATAVRDGQAVIDVTDDGIGMAPEMVARAFDLFAQAERTADRASGGLGLGLALVRSLVELHGGTVACHSAGPGKGSRFTVSLPCLQAPAQPDGQDQAGQATAAAAADEHAGALQIMVVDDNVDAASMLALLLEASGHRVRVEHQPLAALARACAEPPQVFLLDIGLPDIDGYELARRLRAQPQNRDAVLIAVTGYGQESDRIAARNAGFDHHLVKPLDSAALAAILEDVASRRQAHAALLP